MTTKVRIVFDASAHLIGHMSLNDHLYFGENLVLEMLRVWLKFGIGVIGIVADIEKTYLQIDLQESEGNANSLLWFTDPLKSHTDLPEIVAFRMKRVTFGVTCSPFLLAAFEISTGGTNPLSKEKCVRY